MADSNFRGPLTSMGALENRVGVTGTLTVQGVANNIQSDVQPLDGPTIFYQNTGIPDPRLAPFAKDGFRPGQQQGFLTNTDIIAVDNFPQAGGTALLAALQTTSGATLTLVSAQVQNTIAGQAFIAVGVPIIPAGTTVPVTVVALDFGFTTGTTVAASSTVTVLDSTQIYTGQWLCIGGAGNATGGSSLLTQVTSVNNQNITSITVSPVPATGITNAPIGQANLFGGDFLPLATQFGPSSAVPNAVAPYVQGGLGRWANPREAVTRNVAVWAGTTSATAAYTVTGYDIWGNLMTEKLTVPSLANRGAAGSTIWGQKAFKYILSAAIQTASSGSTSLGIGDTFGFPYRCDTLMQAEIVWNNSWAQNANGFIAAYTTAPSSNTTGDVRGTIQVSTNGNGGTPVAISTASVTNGTTRLSIIQNIGVWNTIFTNPNNTIPMFGIPQSTV